ncbi:LysR substrate-binding domain-containing protein, partial [Vibrio parahaemolyticus]
IVVASPGFLNLNSVIHLTDIALAPKLCTGGYHESWQAWLRFQGYKGKVSKPIAEFEHSLLAIQAAVNQLGILLVRDFLVEDELQQGLLVPIGGWSMPSASAHHMVVRESDKPQVEAFTHWVMQSL